MLPTITLQLGDIATFDTELNTPVPWSSDVIQPEADFAEMLNFRIETASDLDIANGTTLPQAGSNLPLSLELESETAVIDPSVELIEESPMDIVLTMSAVPAAGVTQVATVLTTPVVPAPQVENVQLLATIMTPATTAPADGLTRPNLIAAPTDGLTRPNFIAAPADYPSLHTAAEPRENGITRTLPGPVTPIAVNTAPMRSPDTARMTTDRAPKTVPGGVAIEATVETMVKKPPVAAAPPRAITIPGLASQIELSLPPITEVGQQDLTRQIKPVPLALQASVAILPQANPVQTPQLAVQPLGDPALTANLAQVSQAIEIPVQVAAWGERISERVLVMASNQLKSANIRLTPAELGPVRVQLTVDDGAASVTFHAQHATTREAIEMALPRLREMLAENGMTLSQTSITEQGVSHGNRHNDASEEPTSRPSIDESGANGDETSAQANARTSSNSLVDTFA